MLISPDWREVKSAISGQLLNLITQMDGLLHVVRCFEDSNVRSSIGQCEPICVILPLWMLNC